MSVDQRGVECLDERVDRGVCAVDPIGVGMSVDIAHIEFSIYRSRGFASTMRVEFHVDNVGRNERRPARGVPPRRHPGAPGLWSEKATSVFDSERKA